MRIRAPPLTTEYFFRYILDYAAPVLDVNSLEAQGRFFVSGLKRPHHKNNISQIKGGQLYGFFCKCD